MNNRPRVVYIAGTGRCGSTLLERLLACHDGVASVGELHLLPHELAPGPVHLPCGCQLPVADCPFWGAVIDRLSSEHIDALRRFREHHGGGPTLRREALAVLAAGGHRGDIQAYGVASAAVYRAVQGASGGSDVVVDSSKDPYRLLWMVRSGAIDLWVVHLRRHPSGFVRSVRPRPVLAGVPAARFAARKAGAWSTTNLLLRAQRRLLGPARYLSMSYEALAAEPAVALGEVLQAIGVAPDPTVVDRFRDRPTHALGGHPMRFDSGPVALDDRWRSELSRAERGTVAAVSAPARAVLRLADGARPPPRAGRWP